jgi:hypothetical protein
LSRTRRAALVSVAVLVVAELAFRLVAPHLPDPLEWSSEEAQAKVARMTDLRRTGIDVAVVGSSVVDLGVDPAAMGARSYNAAIRGASAEIIAGWTEDVVAPRLHPRTVVIGLTSRELTPNDGEQVNATRDYDRAPAVRQMRHDERWTDRADRTLGRASEIFRYRTVLRRPLLWFGQRKRLDSGVEMTSSGWDRSAADEPYDASPGRRRFFQTVPLHDYTVGAQERRRLQTLATTLRARGIRVLVLNMPVTQDYVALHPHGADDYRAATAAIERLAQRSGSGYVDAGIWPTTLFSDPIHLNGVGARRLSRQIAASVAAAR